MKILILYLIIFLAVNSQLSAVKFDFSPIKLNFSGIEVKNDTTAVYGDNGSMLLSCDNSMTWTQKRIFDKGKIIKLFLEDERWLVFNDMGVIKSSYDDGITWNIITDLKDSVLAVIYYHDGYFVRTRTSLRTLTPSLEKKKSTFFLSKYIDISLLLQYRKSIAYFNNYFVVASDSGNFFIYDKDLNYSDKLSFESLGLCSPCYSYYTLDVDLDYLYTKLGKTIFRTNDLKSFDLFYNCSNYAHLYQLYNNEMYIAETSAYQPYQGGEFNIKFSKVVNLDSAVKISAFNSKAVTNNLYVNDFLLNKGNIILAGEKNFISSNRITDSVLNIVSDLSGCNVTTIPDRINDSTLLIFNGSQFNTYMNYFYRTDNFGGSFKTTVDPYMSPDFKKYNTLLFKYFDKTDCRIYLGGSNRYKNDGGFLISNDTGKSFKFVSIPYINFYSGWMEPYRPYLTNFPNMQKSGQNIILGQTTEFRKKCYTIIYTFNKDFEKVTAYSDSNYVIDYFIDSKDTNTFLIHCLNVIDSTVEIKYTANRGSNWDIIRKYPLSDSMLYLKEFEAFGKRYFAVAYFRHSDSTVNFDLLDIETRKNQKIYDYKSPSLENNALINNGIYGDSNAVYLAVRDTLFFIRDLNDRSKWDYYLFPNHGKVTRTFAKYNSRFFARYSDDFNNDNIFWFTLSDTVKPKPKPIILSEDIDFGKKDIKSKDSVSKKMRIINKSNSANLLIFGYSIPKDSVFQCNLPKVDSLNPLLIEADSSYEFEVSFKPMSAKFYHDSLVFYSNAVDSNNIAHFKGEGIDTATNIDEVIDINENYLYFCPPFPLPASKIVRTKVYWDASYDIDNDVISVFNIFGVRVSGKEAIRIDKFNSYSGYLVWDCSNVEPGVYLLQIKHGTAIKTIKFLKEE